MEENDGCGMMVIVVLILAVIVLWELFLDFVG